MSGIFTLSDPYGTSPCPTIGLHSVTDGSSNTIAFGEALVSITGRGNSYRGNGMATGGDATTSATRRPAGRRAKDTQGLADALAACNAFWKTLPRARRTTTA